VNAVTLGRANSSKFPRNGLLAAFFNAYAAEYPWRDKPKTGLECLNRVVGLVQNEFNRQQGLQQRDPADTKKAEALLAA
jgi:hypothetical protein